jgi:hypothetical protein
MRTRLRPQPFLPLLLGSLLLSGCVYFSRSAARKLGSYGLDSFPTLDLAAVRVAVQHDSRVVVDLDRTGFLVFGGATGRAQKLLHQFHASVRASGPTVGLGLPAAREGFTWTLLEMKPADLQLATQIQELLRDESGQADETARVKASLGRFFPGLEVPSDEHGEIQFSFEQCLDFVDSSVVPRKRFPLSVWLLLDPADGFFNAVDRAVDLDQQYAK